MRGRQRPPAEPRRGGAPLATITAVRENGLRSVFHPVWDTPVINEWHDVAASIVLSGQDLNSSIHRPERCLPAQGFKDIRSSIIEVDAGRSKVRRRAAPVLHRTDGQKIRQGLRHPEGGSPAHSARHLLLVCGKSFGDDLTLRAHRDRFEGPAALSADLISTGLRHDQRVVSPTTRCRAVFRLRDELYRKGRTEEETDHLLALIARGVCWHAMRWDRID